jgi:transcriptional regulator with XRE-family HTH domain
MCSSSLVEEQMPGNRTARTRELDRYIGSRLRERRLMLGMTQGELANEVGLAFQQIQKYENGVDRISASRLFECAIALDIPFGWFVEGATSPVERVAIGRNPGNLSLHRAMNQITDPNCRTALKNLVRVLAKSSVGRPRRQTERVLAREAAEPLSEAAEFL